MAAILFIGTYLSLTDRTWQVALGTFGGGGLRTKPYVLDKNNSISDYILFFFSNLLDVKPVNSLSSTITASLTQALFRFNNKFGFTKGIF